MLLESLILFRKHFHLVFQVLDMLVCLCLAQPRQDIAIQLFSPTCVLVQHRRAQVVLILTVLNQRVHLCAQILQLVLQSRQTRCLHQVSN